MDPHDSDDDNQEPEAISLTSGKNTALKQFTDEQQTRKRTVEAAKDKKRAKQRTRELQYSSQHKASKRSSTEAADQIDSDTEEPAQEEEPKPEVLKALNMRVVSFNAVEKNKPKYLADQPSALEYLTKKLGKTSRRMDYVLFSSERKLGPAKKFVVANRAQLQLPTNTDKLKK